MVFAAHSGIVLTEGAAMLNADWLGRYDCWVEETMIAAEEDIESNNRKAIQAGFDAWRNGTGGVFDLLASDAKWTIVGNSPVSRTFTSRQEFLDVVITPFNARLSSRLVPTVRGV
jgi:uncharacterized protein